MKVLIKTVLSLLIALLAAGASWRPVPTDLLADQAPPVARPLVARPVPIAAPQTPTPTAEVEIAPQAGLKEPKIVSLDRPTVTPGDLTRADSQGTVAVGVTPLNLGNPGSTLEFEVRMDSATLELSLNLAKLASLTTDNGLEVSASAWQPEGAGRHVSGRLTFPSTFNGSPFLGYARVLTLSIRHLEVPLRTFTWELSKP